MTHYRTVLCVYDYNDLLLTYIVRSYPEHVRLARIRVYNARLLYHYIIYAVHARSGSEKKKTEKKLKKYRTNCVIRLLFGFIPSVQLLLRYTYVHG